LSHDNEISDFLYVRCPATTRAVIFYATGRGARRAPEDDLAFDAPGNERIVTGASR